MWEACSTIVQSGLWVSQKLAIVRLACNSSGFMQAGFISSGNILFIMQLLKISVSGWAMTSINQSTPLVRHYINILWIFRYRITCMFYGIFYCNLVEIDWFAIYFKPDIQINVVTLNWTQWYILFNFWCNSWKMHVKLFCSGHVLFNWLEFWFSVLLIDAPDGIFYWLNFVFCPSFCAACYIDLLLDKTLYNKKRQDIFIVSVPIYICWIRLSVSHICHSSGSKMNLIFIFFNFGNTCLLLVYEALFFPTNNFLKIVVKTLFMFLFFDWIVFFCSIHIWLLRFKKHYIY